MNGGTRRLARAAATVGSLTLLSRFAGFARDMALAAVIGAGPAADAVLVAVRLATLVRRLLADGALNVSFVPLYAEARGESPAAARAFAGAVLGAASAFGVLALVAVLAAMPALVALQAPGFVEAPARFAAAIHLARLAALYLPLAGPVAVLGALLQAEGRFAPASLAAVSFNLVLIAALVLARPLGFAPAPGFALATAVGGLVQLALVAIAAMRAGAMLAWPRLRPGPAPGRPLLRTLGRRVLPGAASIGVGQLNALIGVAIASLLPAGAISALYYAERLVGLPLGVVGAAMATALLPALAGHAAAGDHGAARGDLSAALTLGLGLALPAAAGLAVAAWPIVAVLFGRGAFAPGAVTLTAQALAAAAAALPAQALARILTSVHYATGDTARPLRFAIWAALANAVLGLVLAWPFGVVGIALAASLASWLQAGLAARDLRRRGWAGYDPALAGRVVRLVLAALAMAAAVALVAHRLAPTIAAPGHDRWLALAAILAAGLGAYGSAVAVSGVLGPQPLRRAWGRFRNSAAS